MRTNILAVLLVMLAAHAAWAADTAAAKFVVHALSPHMEFLTGQGSNITIGWDSSGAVLVDDGLSDAAPALVAEVRKHDPSGRVTVINTHWHFDHVLGNTALAAAGGVILAHTNAARRMASGGTIMLGGKPKTFAPASKTAVPSRTYDDTTSLTAGGDVITVLHVPHAHTDGDSLIKWTKANVLDMGDVYVRYGLPFVDISSGGNLEGFIKGVEAGLRLCDGKTVVIPGHGNPATCTDLAAYRDRLRTIATGVQRAIANGRSLEQVQALRLADGWKQDDGFWPPKDFIAMAYRSYKTN